MQRCSEIIPASLLLAGWNEPFVGEREELVRVDLHAPHLPVVRAVVGERPKKSVRLLLGEDRVQLAVDRAALLVIERELALDDQPVHFGVGVAAEVVLPGADFRRVEQRRDVGRVVEHPGREHDIEVVLEEYVLLPGLPLLELDRDRNAYALEVVLEREHDALDRFALLLDRDLERQRQFLAVLLNDAVGAGLETGLREQRARPLGVERRSEEHTSELQSRENLVCRLLLEKKKKNKKVGVKMLDIVDVDVSAGWELTVRQHTENEPRHRSVLVRRAGLELQCCTVI